jgi:hypothetical protein
MLVPLAIAGAGLSCNSPASPVNVELFELLSVSASSNGGGSCTSSGLGLSRGTLFTAPPAGLAAGASYPCCGYTVGVEVRNDLPTQSDNSVPPLAVDAHEVILDTLTAKYEFIPTPGESAPVVLRDEVLAISAIVPSGGSTETFVSPLLSTSEGTVLQGLSGELNVTVTFSGHTRDGSGITAAPILFPIDVSNSPPPVCPSSQVPAPCGVDSFDQGDGFICVAEGG